MRLITDRIVHEIVLYTTTVSWIINEAAVFGSFVNWEEAEWFHFNLLSWQRAVLEFVVVVRKPLVHAPQSPVECVWRRLVFGHLEVIKVDSIKHGGRHHRPVTFDLCEQGFGPTRGEPKGRPFIYKEPSYTPGEWIRVCVYCARISMSETHISHLCLFNKRSEFKPNPSQVRRGTKINRERWIGSTNRWTTNECVTRRLHLKQKAKSQNKHCLAQMRQVFFCVAPFSPLLVDFDVRVQDGHHVGRGGLPPRVSGVRETSLLAVPHSCNPETRVLLLGRLYVRVEVLLQVVWNESEMWALCSLVQRWQFARLYRFRNIMKGMCVYKRNVFIWPTAIMAIWLWLQLLPAFKSFVVCSFIFTIT